MSEQLLLFAHNGAPVAEQPHRRRRRELESEVWFIMHCSIARIRTGYEFWVAEFARRAASGRSDAPHYGEFLWTDD